MPVLLSPDPAGGSIIGLLIGGMAVEVADVVITGANKWAKLILTAGGVNLQQVRVQDAVSVYVSAESFVDALEPPPAPTVKVGLSVIYNADAAFKAANMGCRFFCIVGHIELGSQLKDAFPDATVMVRPYLDIHGNLPSFDYVMGKLKGAKDPRLIYTGLNESEQLDTSPDSLRKRAAFDIEMANRIKAASGALYAAGSFSMGTPDFTRTDICDAIRTYYAPPFNAGVFWMDHHLYSPNMQHIYREDIQTPTWNGQKQVVVETDWYETRWHFYYTRCGFDPKSSSRIVCSETGVDEGSIGGFAAHHATDQDVVAWCKRYIQIAGAPLVLNGNTYNSPFVGGAIFAVGDPVNWAGYDMTRYELAMGPDVWYKPLAPAANFTQELSHMQMTDLAMHVMNLSQQVNKTAASLQRSIKPDAAQKQ
ncbi:MAG: hypothetical protein M1140_09780 [Chloroflexi bacterium]|nr:hypothetical protein [Chloroflexota bacterium]